MSLLVFPREPYAGLRDAICRANGHEPGQVEVRVFPDGERDQRLVTPVRDPRVVLLADAVSDARTATSSDLACGIVANGARGLTLLLP